MPAIGILNPQRRTSRDSKQSGRRKRLRHTTANPLGLIVLCVRQPFWFNLCLLAIIGLSLLFPTIPIAI